MEMTEFLNRDQNEIKEEEIDSEELDVQKAVVESLAADKAEQDEKIFELQKLNNSLQSEVSKLKSQIDEMKVALANVGDVLAKNSESELSSKIALLDRNAEIADKFQSETHDHVIEVIRDAYALAEKEGRVRRAQLLESVLLVNEASGILRKKRMFLEKLFYDNGNILSGPVIEELDKQGISYKNGDDYLMPSEILKRTY